jgi:MazG family protein
MTRPRPIDDERALTHPTDEERASFGAAYERIVGIMARLRSPGGCPWDLAQDLKTLRPYLLEEAYEVLEALEDGTPIDHREELGDLLLQVIFQAEIRRQEGAFDAADVAHAIADKLVRRHPHVFGKEVADGIAESFDRWETQKAKEKAGRSAVDGVPRALPALLRAQRTGEKAARVGFDWSDVKGTLGKLKEEVAELEQAITSGDKAAIEAELGDLLFSATNVARFQELSAEDALHAAVHRFRERFKHVEGAAKARSRSLKEMSQAELDELWEAAKRDQ